MKQSKGLQKRAVKAGRRASIRNGGNLSRDELLQVKVQLVPAWGRWLLFSFGLLSFVAGVCGWPCDEGVIRGLEFLAGLVLMFGGVFGLKKTLSTIADMIDLGQGADLLEVVAEGVGAVIGAVLDV